MKMILLRPEERHKLKIWVQVSTQQFNKCELRLLRKIKEREEKRERVLACQARKLEQHRREVAKRAIERAEQRARVRLRKLRKAFVLRGWERANLKAKWLTPWYEDELKLDR